jgi:hypothetical protein
VPFAVLAPGGTVRNILDTTSYIKNFVVLSHMPHPLNLLSWEVLWLQNLPVRARVSSSNTEA